MLALDPRVIDMAWEVLETLIPERPAVDHPLGTHRQRIPDKDCFIGLLQRLVTGCSWDVTRRLCGIGETTLRTRRTEWLECGLFDEMVSVTLGLFDNEIGLDLEEIVIDGSSQKAPFGGQGTGPNPTDRAKSGWKWSIATEGNGIPIGWAIDGANRHDSKLLTPTLLDIVKRDLFDEVTTIYLDRGYDTGVTLDVCADMGIEVAVIAERRKQGTETKKVFEPLGQRWTVERTNSWFTDYGQMRRNTDRFIDQRLGQMALAIAMMIFVKLFKHNR